MPQPAEPGKSRPEGEALLKRIEEALGRAVGEALRRHKLAGNPVAIWRDNQVVWVAPEDIPDDIA